MALKISEIITKLSEAKAEFGDLPVSTWDGMIYGVIVSPSTDGVVPDPGDKITELSLEIRTD